MNRVELLKNQLAVKPEPSQDSEDARKLLSKYRSKSTINADVLSDLIYGRHRALRQRCIDIMANDPIFKPYTATESNRKELRATSLHWIKTFMSKFGPITYEDYKKDPAILPVFINALCDFDGSLSVKTGVHFNLYTKTIINLGTEKHRPYIDRAFSLDDIGCFGLTELGHGSNAKGILTRADFEPKTREFIITTPVDIAMKFWIGAAAHLANNAVVMAQLYVGDKNYGVHGFIVPIRDKRDHTLLPGVIAGDCGLKVGMNAIDNGFLIFKGVRIPYDNLLDRFSTIAADGKFKSPIKSADKRFGISLGSLSGGRLQIVETANIMLRTSLTVAIRFAACRRQFGAPQAPETNILEYPLMQYRLLPYLAESLALSFANYPISETWCANQDKIFKENNPMLTEIHNLSSALKPISTWITQKGIQECREACGGLGYSAYNRIGQMREDNDINATWEGDNHVLLQQTSKFLLDSLRTLKGGEKLPFPSLQFLQPEFNFNDYIIDADGKSAFSRDQFSIQRAFEVRANFLIHSSFDNFQKNMMNTENVWQAWNDSHVFYLKEASLAYGEVHISNQFARVVDECKDEKTKQVLIKLYNLYGFNKLEQRASTFFEIGYFNKEDLAMIRQRVKELLLEIKDEAVGLVDVIAIPDQLLNSPIGAYDGDIYNRFINAVWTAPGALERPAYWKEIRGDSK